MQIMMMVLLLQKKKRKKDTHFSSNIGWWRGSGQGSSDGIALYVKDEWLKKGFPFCPIYVPRATWLVGDIESAGND